MHRVILTATAEQKETLAETMLSRDDVEIVRIDRIGQSIHELFIRPCPLWVAFDDPEVALPALCDELYKQYPSNLAIFILTSDPPRFAKTGYIKLVAPLQFDVRAMNEAVALALNLPLRKGVRLPVRLSVHIGQEQSTSLVTTVTISSVGMLVESLTPLREGATCEFRFAGAKGAAELPAMSARVIREERSLESGARVKFYSMEFLGVPKEKMEEILKRIVHDS